MLALRSFWSVAFVFNVAIALIPKKTLKPTWFGCTGGSIYFTAHPVDVLLYQNPDLFHKLYVFKCVTTVVFTSGDRGILGNFSLSLERGLENAFSWMTGLTLNESSWVNTTLRLGSNDVLLRSHEYMSNMQILYLRLPDGAPNGQGYEANSGESLRKLYKKETKTITTTDGSTAYTLNSLKYTISTILHIKKPKDVRVLNQKARIPNVHNAGTDHADHVVSSKLIVDVMKRDKIKAKLQGYASGVAWKLEPNLDLSHADFERKTGAFFKYTEYDEYMCQSYDECVGRFKDKNAPLVTNDDDAHIAQWMEREYYIL